jgi:hypothetical protein
VTPDQREHYHERAAIMEHCGGLTRYEAERLARDKPWERDPRWGLPQPHQPDLIDDGGFSMFQQWRQQQYGR